MFKTDGMQRSNLNNQVFRGVVKKDNSSKVVGAILTGKRVMETEGVKKIPEPKLGYYVPEAERGICSKIFWGCCKAVVAGVSIGAATKLGFLGLKLFYGIVQVETGENPYKSDYWLIAGTVVCCVPPVALALSCMWKAFNALDRYSGFSKEVDMDNQTTMALYRQNCIMQETSELNNELKKRLGFS